jgi:hypothetical protein
MAKMGLISPGTAAAYGAGMVGQSAADKTYGAAGKLGLSEGQTSGLLAGAGPVGAAVPLLRYSSKNELAQQLGNLSNEQLDKIGGMKQFGDVSSKAINTLESKRQAAQNAITGGIGGAGRALGGIAKKFCFAPDTLVQMADGSYIEIQDVRLGDHLTQGGLVYSISSHLVDESQVYEYNGIIVTADHAVQEDGMWIRVKNSKVAKPAPGATSVVYSLSNINHRIVTRSATFADYDEVDNSEGLDDIQCLMILNRSK